MAKDFLALRRAWMEDEVAPHVRRLRNARGWSQSIFTAKLQFLGLEISRSIFSKIEARLNYVDDTTMLYLAEALRVPIQDRFPSKASRQPFARIPGKA